MMAKLFTALCQISPFLKRLLGKGRLEKSSCNLANVPAHVGPTP